MTAIPRNWFTPVSELPVSDRGKTAMLRAGWTMAGDLLTRPLGAGVGRLTLHGVPGADEVHFEWWHHRTSGPRSITLWLAGGETTRRSWDRAKVKRLAGAGGASA